MPAVAVDRVPSELTLQVDTFPSQNSLGIALSIADECRLKIAPAVKAYALQSYRDSERGTVAAPLSIHVEVKDHTLLERGELEGAIRSGIKVGVKDAVQIELSSSDIKITIKEASQLSANRDSAASPFLTRSEAPPFSLNTPAFLRRRPQ